MGRPAAIAWWPGIRALPRRYLVDVHAVVARDPYAARMHALAAGGLLLGALLQLVGLCAAWRSSRIYWAAISLSFLAMLLGSVMVARRRLPQRPPRLSGGRFSYLPWLLLAYAVGSLLTALSVLLGLRWSAWLGDLVAVPGLLGLVWMLRTGPMRHAFAGAVHLIAHPRPRRFAGGLDTALRPLDMDADKLGASSIVDFSWNQLAGVDACVQCGRCEEVCPAFAAGQPLSPKRLIQDLVGVLPGHGMQYTGRAVPLAPSQTGCGQGGLVDLVGTDAAIRPEALWSCTTCRACVESCPMMIEHVDAIIDLRRFQMLEIGAAPASTQAPLAALRYTDTVAAKPLVGRGDFAAGLPLPRMVEGQAVDVLLWLGEGAFDLRYGRTLRALLQLLMQAGVDYACLGEEERDCGDLARRLGDEAGFQRLARSNIDTLNRYAFQRIVTADPHALHVLRREYPAFGGNYTVQHHSGLLDELMQQGRLLPRRTLATGTLAYHDPCYLARYNGEIDAPRRVLDRLGVNRTEMARHGRQAMCCGAGGGAAISDIAGKRRIPDLRMEQATAVRADIVAVACPGCTAMLEGVVEPRPQVRDIAELLLDAMGPTP